MTRSARVKAGLAAMRPRGDSYLARLLRRPVAAVSLVYLAAVVFACLAAPWVTSQSPYAADFTAVMQKPSWHHLLGTDNLGRDVLSRLLYGGRTSLLGVVEAVVVVACTGTVLGLLSGYFGGWTDRLISRAIDVIIAIPLIVVVLGVLAVFGNSMLAAMVCFGLLAGAGLGRIVRGVVLGVRHELYVTAAEVSGLSRRSILFRHVLPRVTGPLVVQLALLAGIALGIQTGLSFLNLGVVLPAPSWGGMVGTASQVLSQDSWLIVPPTVTIVLTILAFGFVGDAVRDLTVERWATSVPSAEGRASATKNRRRALGTAGTDREPDLPGALLSVRGLSIAFGSEAAEERSVLADVSFDVFPGEVVGLVGESGSGKTLTALAILGLLPNRAQVQRGRIVVGETDVLRADEKTLHRIRGQKVGFVSQEPVGSLDPCFRVGGQVVEVVRRHANTSRPEATKRALELLNAVQLPEPAAVMEQFPHELSGGMAQRVAIAIALAGDPELLVADEPTTALDVTVQAEILDLLRLLQEERRMAVLFITHNLAVVADLCERAIVLQRGRVVETSNVEELFYRPRHEYTKALISATPSLLEPRPVGNAG